MRFTESASDHGIEAADVEHALRNPVRVYDFEGGWHMIIGPAKNGTMLEIGYRPSTDTLFHAMPARRKF